MTRHATQAMMTSFRSVCAAFLVSLLISLQCPNAALACATCGCSELCPLTMVDEGTYKTDSHSLLSNSIWGTMILKMAYDRDPELQKLRGLTKGVNVGTAGTLAAAAAGTLPQGTIAIATLNPPDGIPDSYAPGIVGLALIGATNMALWTRFGLNGGLRRKIRARQLAISQRVESILHHLEFSETNCPDAQKELAEIIGERAASECIVLWCSSHAVASVPPAGG